MNIGAKIKYYRKLNNISQTELASKLHITNKAVSAWEAGRTQPRMDMVEKICEILNCRKSDLLEEQHNYSVSEEEYDLILKYRKSDEVTQIAIKRMLNWNEKKED